MNTEYVIAAIERLVDAKVNLATNPSFLAIHPNGKNLYAVGEGVRQAQKELRKAFGEADLAPCAAKLKVDFEEALPKTRCVTFLYDKGNSCPTRRMIQVDEDEYGFISGMDVDKDEYRRFSKLKIIGNIEEIV